jgi:hypothetical protein
MEPGVSRPGIRRAASRIVIVLALYQGAVPLVVRSAFGGDQRFAPALWLPSPWWWIVCLAIVAVAVALAAALDGGEVGPSAREAERPEATAAGTGDEPAERPAGDGTAAAYDALSAVVFLVGFYNGVAPFVARLVFGGDLLLALTLRLPSPWWWIASLGVIAVAVVLLTLIDSAKQRDLSES